jgi:hypothetical protein
VDFAHRVLVAIETKVDNAKAGLAGYKQSISEAEGFTGKLKAGVSGLADGITAAATSPAVLAAGIGAVTAVGAKAISMFENTALAVGKFGDAAGLAPEPASRLYEVLSDLGIAPESVTGAINRLNKTIASSPEALDKYGIAIARTADGNVDAGETFNRVIEGLSNIKDPAARALAGTELLGKGWTSLADVVAGGGPKLRQALADVQPSKVFTAADINSAKDLRDGFDSIKDAGEGFLLTVGKALAPAVATIAKTLGDAISKAQPLAEVIGKTLTSALKIAAPVLELAGKLIPVIAKAAELAFKPIELLADGVTSVTNALGNLLDPVEATVVGSIAQAKAANDAAAATKANTDELADNYRAASEAGRGTKAFAGQLDQAADAGYDLATALERDKAKYAELTGAINLDKALLDLPDTFDAVKKAGTEALEAVAGGAEDADKKQRDFAKSVDDAKLKVLDIAKQIGGIPPETVTKLLAQVDAGQFDAVEQALKNLARDRPVNLTPHLGQVTRYAAGTSYHPGGPAIINDDPRYPGSGELVELPTGAKVYPAGRGGRAVQYVDASTLIVNVGPGQTAANVAALTRKNNRRNGAGTGWGLS